MLSIHAEWFIIIGVKSLRKGGVFYEQNYASDRNDKERRLKLENRAGCPKYHSCKAA